MNKLRAFSKHTENVEIKLRNNLLNFTDEYRARLDETEE